MTNQIVGFLLIFTFLIGCENSNVVIEKFSNGKLKSQITIEEGMKNGEALRYDSLGNLRERMNYRNDTLEGGCITYYKTGEIRTIVNYRSGKKEGAYSSFFKNGNIAQYGYYKDDYRRGVWNNYSESDSGKVILENYVMHIEGDIDDGDPYYVKELSERGVLEYTYKTVNVTVPKKAKVGDTITVGFEIFRTFDFDSALIIIGDFDENFVPGTRLDTVWIEDRRAKYQIFVNGKDVFFVRGLLRGINRVKSSNPEIVEETLEDLLYFEEAIQVE